jgi:pimeloyl-ACP methyl ester carboxylesterase
MARHAFKKSTIVRIRLGALRTTFAVTERAAPALGGRIAERIWFTLPPTPTAKARPQGGRDFTVRSQGAMVRGTSWGSGPVVYLVHGWGGRAGQLDAFVEPLVRRGYTVVAFDAPSHGASEAGPSGPRRSTAVELARALDDVAARFGPAHGVVAHSLGAMATMLAVEHGWLGVRRLALVAPMLDIDDALTAFGTPLGIGPRTRDRLGRRIAARVGLPLQAFSAQRLLVGGLPTLVAHDHADRQTPYAGSAGFVDRHPDAVLLTTFGLGHHRILRDAEVVAAAVAHVTNLDAAEVDIAS